MIVFLGGYAAFLAFGLRGKKVFLDITGDRLVLDEGRGGAFPLSGAALGLWRMASVGVNAGTVLHLAGGGRMLRVGGRDHRPGAALRMDASPVDSVDVFLPAEAFDALLASVPFLAYPPHAAQAPRRCQLLPSPFSARGVLVATAPWVGSMMLVGIVSVVLGTMGLFDSAAGQRIALPLLAAIVVAVFGLSAVHSARKRAALEIEADSRELRLRDPRTGRLLAAALSGAVATARGVCRIHVRGATFEYAALAIRIPGHEDVTLCVHDTRFGWNDATPRWSAPRYVVGPPDWYALVEVLGMRPSVVVRDH
jgi:hypothetical protein